MIWLTEAKGPFFAKPACGDRGRGIVRGCFEGDSVRLNGRLLGRMEFQAQLAATGEPYILTAAVEQHPEMASFFPETVNTVRVLMMREPSGEAFVADAVLRLGTSSSGGVDNFSKGGLSFSIDTAVGKIGQGRRKTGAVFENHPDTGAPVSGCFIPHWLVVIDCCHAAMVQQPGLQYVGWDVVVARDGPVLIEGNNKSDVNLIQAHRPLLANSRVRSFYERHGLCAMSRRQVCNGFVAHGYFPREQSAEGASFAFRHARPLCAMNGHMGEALSLVRRSSTRDVVAMGCTPY